MYALLERITVATRIERPSSFVHRTKVFLFRRYYVEHVVAIFSHKIQSEYYFVNKLVSI